ncbi:MAG: arsenate reductase ArsC [Deltaproteobacteria bacterium]|nr:arsenate reductase ArsC [Deltaproteobacteria bacterium]
MKAPHKIRIVYLCTGNSCRSQMAEAWTRELKGDLVEPYSAGIEVHALDPLAVQVMAEVGLDISHQRSKHIDAVRHLTFDYVITLCDHAHQTCPVFPSDTKVVHKAFDDPPGLASKSRTREEAVRHYRRVRDEIRAFVETLPDALEESTETKDPIFEAGIKGFLNDLPGKRTK